MRTIIIFRSISAATSLKLVIRAKRDRVRVLLRSFSAATSLKQVGRLDWDKWRCLREGRALIGLPKLYRASLATGHGSFYNAIHVRDEPPLSDLPIGTMLGICRTGGEDAMRPTVDPILSYYFSGEPVCGVKFETEAGKSLTALGADWLGRDPNQGWKIDDHKNRAGDLSHQRRSCASGERVMPTGTILNFDPHSAFGFIRPDADRQNIYYHLRSYPLGKIPEVGTRVIYDLAPDNRRRVVGKHASHRRQVADVAIDDAEQRNDGRLVGGY
jgi:cold shock CspA family protein